MKVEVTLDSNYYLPNELWQEIENHIEAIFKIGAKAKPIPKPNGLVKDRVHRKGANP